MWAMVKSGELLWMDSKEIEKDCSVGPFREQL